MTSQNLLLVFLKISVRLKIQNYRNLKVFSVINTSDDTILTNVQHVFKLCLLSNSRCISNVALLEDRCASFYRLKRVFSNQSFAHSAARTETPWYSIPWSTGGNEHF